MDTKEKKKLAQQQMDELKKALKSPQVVSATSGAFVTSNGSDYGYESASQQYSNYDTITLSSGGAGQPYNNTVVGGGYYTSLTGLNQASQSITGANFGPFTINAGAGLNYNNTTISSNGLWGSNTINTVSGQLKLEGENADVVINGVSLLQILQDRLAVLIPNPKLEQEWDQLKELGDQYRALEAKLKEQSEMWKKLKEMPPPEPLY